MNAIIQRSASAALALALCGTPAAAQAPAAAAFTVQPLTAPLELNRQASPRFRFAGEAVNAGAPIPKNPGRVVLEGSGWMSAGERLTVWNLQFERMTLDNAVIVASAPLGSLALNIDVAPGGGRGRSFTTSFDGLLRSQYGTFPGALRIIKSIADTTAQALYDPPRYPIGDRAPVLDLNPALQRHVFFTLRGAQLVQGAPPATAAGVVGYLGRQGLLVRQAGPFVVRAYGQDLRLQSDAHAIVDMATALPLIVQARVTGNPPPPVPGQLDYTFRLAFALDNMPDPLQTLAAAAAPPPPPAPPPPAPVAAPAPRPAPAAAPAPRPPPAAAPAGTSALQQQRLQSLKGLYDQGLISREQYELRQREILSGQ